MLGETVGTFILVFFGCGVVMVNILFSAHTGLFQVAALWGIGVTLAIYATRHLSCAHLNPAVSIAMVLGDRMRPSKLIPYLVAQFAGAFIAAAAIYLLFSDSIAAFETHHAIIRGTPASIKTAMAFGEFFPNPASTAKVTELSGFMAEAFGTFFLVLFIFSLTEGCNIGRPDDRIAPLFIGLTVTIIISVIAPLTQAGLNPARDLSPRIFAALAGWGKAAFPDPAHGFLTVYVIAPIIGGGIAALGFTRIIEPMMTTKSNDCGCK